MDISTNTIADLYVKQGHPEKAIDIYRTILEIEPDNEEAKRKLHELETQMSDHNTVQDEVTATAPAEEAAVAGDVNTQITKLEEWLGKIRSVRGEG